MLIEVPGPVRRQRESGGLGMEWRFSVEPVWRSASAASALQSAAERCAAPAASVVGFSPLIPRDWTWDWTACSPVVPDPDDPQPQTARSINNPATRTQRIPGLYPPWAKLAQAVNSAAN